jgi:hypothetical protein
MTITASPSKSIPLRADLPAATAALAQIAGCSSQLDQFSSINKAALDCIYLLSPRRSIKQPIRSTRQRADRAAPRSKSP